jgi:hypothetical protein
VASIFEETISTSLTLLFCVSGRLLILGTSQRAAVSQKLVERFLNCLIIASVYQF